MDINIHITKEDLGFSPKKVKSLLSKFDIVSKTPNPKSFLVFLDFHPQDTNELSTAIMWRLLFEHKNLNCKKHIRSIGTATKYFDERHFFDSLVGKKTPFLSSSVPINFETFNPVRPNKTDNQSKNLDEIFKKTTQNILDTKKPFESEIRTHMMECIQNAFDHSESTQDKSAGIVCSLKKDILDFCIVDMGQGIKKSFLSNPALKDIFISLNNAEVISRATQKKTSCNPSHARNLNYTYGNGGIGLYYLKEFVRHHPGSHLVIISEKGYYYLDYRSSQEKTSQIPTPWKGTIVYFRAKLGQEKSKQYEDLCGEFIEGFDNR